MNILQVSSVYRPAWGTGGTARFVTHLSEQLVENNHNVTVFTTDRGKESRLDVPTEQPIELNRVTVYYFRNLSNTLVDKIRLVTPYKSPLMLREMINEFDIIHIHEHRSLLAAVVAHYARKENIPYIIQEHGSLSIDQGKGAFKKVFDLGLGNQVINSASGFIAQTEHEKSEYIEWGIDPHAIRTVPLGISIDELLQSPEGAPLSRRCGVDQSTPILLYLGRLDEIKGIDLLIRSLPLIREQIGEDVQLAVVGPDHGDETRLKKISNSIDQQDNVHFLGPLYGGEKYRTFKDASVYILPSLYESFSITVLEAGFLGTPVAISDRCSIKNLLQENDAALVFKRSKGDLAKKVYTILNDSARSGEIANNIKNLIQEQLTWCAVTDQIDNVYEEFSLDNQTTTDRNTDN